mgnify:CR=1 FL=1
MIAGPETRLQHRRDRPVPGRILCPRAPEIEERDRRPSGEIGDRPHHEKPRVQVRRLPDEHVILPLRDPVDPGEQIGHPEQHRHEQEGEERKRPHRVLGQAADDDPPPRLGREVDENEVEGAQRQRQEEKKGEEPRESELLRVPERRAKDSDQPERHRPPPPIQGIPRERVPARDRDLLRRAARTRRHRGSRRGPPRARRGTPRPLQKAPRGDGVELSGRRPRSR